MKKKQGWTLPLVFLLGYIVAWGTIHIDRQMLVSEQKELRQALARTKQELRLQEMMEDFGQDWQEMVIWNEEKKEDPPKEAESGQVDK